MSGYKIYNAKYKRQVKFNGTSLESPPLPNKRYAILYADPPWHYNQKMQFDRSGKKHNNPDWQKDIFISSACFKYPTLTTKELMTIPIGEKLAEQNSLLFMWSTNPHLAQAIALGEAWGFEYKTVAFVWNKQVHNPGQYTLSYCELCLLFKRGKIPRPRGARNIKQLIEEKRGSHSAKPAQVASDIAKMFPTQARIELFARDKKQGWDSWGLEVPT